MTPAEKKEALLAHAAAEFINRESNRESLITVTRALLSPDEKQVTIFVSVLPEAFEESALSFLKRQRAELRTFIKTHARTRLVPFLDFAIDYGEKNRQDIDRLSLDK